MLGTSIIYWSLPGGTFGDAALLFIGGIGTVLSAVGIAGILLLGGLMLVGSQEGARGLAEKTVLGRVGLRPAWILLLGYFAFDVLQSIQ